MGQMNLPLTFEDTVRLLGGAEHVNAKLMQFVQPVEETEQQLLEIATQMGAAGRAVFLLGGPGTGKSTFIQSLQWRPHIRISALESVNAAMFKVDECLEQLLDRVREVGSTAVHRRDLGAALVVVNYLEDLEGIDPGRIRAFFRALNGLLRQYPVLLVWPVTNRADAEQMIGHANRVSGTLFHPDRAIVPFSGPAAGLFPTIASNTIAVLNEGQRLQDFGLTPDDLDEALEGVQQRGDAEVTIRNYLREVYDRWVDRSGQLDVIRRAVPRPTEVWFVFSHEHAEAVVEQFARKSVQVQEAWLANHGKLYEYIYNNQRAADWDARRLQFAIGGALTCRIMYMPTNALVAVLSAYGNGYVEAVDLKSKVPAGWFHRGAARRLLAKTPLLRQLRGQEVKLGKRRSGTVPGAMERAKEGFAALSEWASGIGPGSDEPLNHALGLALSDVLGDVAEAVEVEQPHPWLPNVVPDIRVDTAGRHVCIEMSYTNRDEPYVAADYVLRKLDRYMKQLEAKLRPVRDAAARLF
jgi:hypothetical protein